MSKPEIIILILSLSQSTDSFRELVSTLLLSYAQADLSLRWAHMPFCWFCHEAAHIIHVPSSVKY